jgi:hypothetical protein
MADEAAVSAPAVSAPAATPVAAPAAVATPSPVSATPAAASSSEPSPVTVTGNSEPRAGEDSGDFFAPKADEAVVDDAVVTTPDTEEPVADDGADNVADEIPDPAQGEEYDPFEETPGAFSPKDLNAKIASIPGLKEAFESDPDFKNSIFANSRLAAETSAFKEVFHNAEEAKVAAAGNAEFATLSNLVTSIDKPEDAQAFYARLMELSINHDEDGNPVIDAASGKPVSDGTVGRLIHHTGALFLDHFGREAEATNDPELTAAVDILKARAFGSGTASTSEDLTEEQRVKATELDARETSLKEQSKAVHAGRVKEFNQSVTSGIDLSTDAEITKLLARTDIPEKDRVETANKIRQGIYDLIVANPSFQGEQDMLMHRLMGDKTRVARIGLGKKYVDMCFTKVATKIVADAGAKILSRQAKTQAAQAARVEASRSEAAGTLRTARPTTARTSDDIAAKASANLETRLGRAPSFTESLAEIKRLRSAQ